MRVDEGARAATVVSLPSNLQVKLSDGAAHPLYDVAALGGDAALVEAVAGFAGVNVSHFARTDAEGIAHLVDAVGGVLVNVAEEVDDPTAGDVYLAEGEQALDGAAALTLLRAQNYAGGVESQAANRAAFFFALANKLMEPHGLGMIMRLDQTASDVQTDWKTLDLMALADALRGLQTTYAASVPGHETSVDGTSQYVASGGDWTNLMDRVRAGDDPAAPEAAAPAVDPASFTVAVRNGTDVTGSAAQLTKTLEAQGFKVVETGNVDDYTVYPETLVIYHDEALSPAADAVVKAMGAGRAHQRRVLLHVRSGRAGHHRHRLPAHRLVRGRGRARGEGHGRPCAMVAAARCVAVRSKGRPARADGVFVGCTAARLRYGTMRTMQSPHERRSHPWLKRPTWPPCSN